MSEFRETAYLVYGAILGLLCGLLGNIVSDSYYDYFVNHKSEVTIYLVTSVITTVAMFIFLWYTASKLERKAKLEKDEMKTLREDIQTIKQEISEINKRLETIENKE